MAERALAEFVHKQGELFPAEEARIIQLLVERVNVQEEALEMRIRAEGWRAWSASYGNRVKG